MLRNGDFERDPGQFFEWVKFRSHLSRGVTAGTMLQDEAFHFLRLGTFLERADNTARLVDVKFHAVQNDFMGTDGEKDQEYDFYHWSAILRSVSGFEVYRKVYRDVIKPERVAELLILRPDMPRSLLACLNELMSNLAMVTSDTASETQRRAGKLRADLQYARIDEILATGLHAFLTQFLDRVNEIGAHISPRISCAGDALKRSAGSLHVARAPCGGRELREAPSHLKLHVRHITDYRYTEPLRYALQTLWLTPQSGPAQTVSYWSLGAPEKLFTQRDAFGNTISSYTFVGKDADNVRWSLVNAAGDVETLGVAEFNDAETLPHPYFFCAPPTWPSRTLNSLNSAVALSRKAWTARPACRPCWP